MQLHRQLGQPGRLLLDLPGSWDSPVLRIRPSAPFRHIHNHSGTNIYDDCQAHCLCYAACGCASVMSMLETLTQIVGTLILAWLAGAAANWAADSLPARARDRDLAVDPPATSRRYLLLPWPTASIPGAGPRWRSLLLKMAMALLFLVAWWRFRAHPLLLLVAWLYIAYLLAALVIDLETRRVLNVMTAPAAVIALLFSLLPGMPGPLSALVGGAAAFGGFLALFVIGRGRAMGLGDVKLAGVIGLMLGYPAVLPALFIGILLGGLAALGLLITRKAGRKSYMAYAPYLCLGAIVVLLRLVTPW
jgi:leader peptidase (prepilin peptidase) / N-methyltransferase